MTDNDLAAITRWHFQASTNKNGCTYIKAYSTRWVRSLHKSKIIANIHVGRLREDGSIAFSRSDKFRSLFPQYSEGQWYWGTDNRPVTAEQHDAACPARPGPKPKMEETAEEDDMREIGPEWATYRKAVDTGVRDGLIRVAGEKDGPALLSLIIYRVCDHDLMSCYENWIQEVCLPGLVPLDDDSISELLSRVTENMTDEFFRLRHEEKAKQAGEEGILQYALDNTTISTYSETISDVEWGRSKQDTGIRQINFTVVCDQKDGEIVYSHEYAGSVSDVSEFGQIMSRMAGAGFDLTRTVLVTDRGYSSRKNVDDMVGREMLFVQGVPITQNEVRTFIDRYRGELNDYANYDPGLMVTAWSVKESGEENAGGTMTWLHLYRLPHIAEDLAQRLTFEADKIVELKNLGRAVEAGKMTMYGRYVLENKTGKWGRNNDAIRNRLRYGDFQVLRSNYFVNPLDALSCYRRRSIVELDFNEFKNRMHASRLQCTDRTYIGRLFVSTVATSLRMMMLHSAHQNQTPKNRIPDNSISKLLRELKTLKAVKRKKANAWVTRTVTKTHRNMFELIGVEPPPTRLNM